MSAVAADRDGDVVLGVGPQDPALWVIGERPAAGSQMAKLDLIASFGDHTLTITTTEAA